MLLSLVIQGFPFAFLMILGYVSGINPDLEKASQMLGASRAQTFVRVLFPLMVPGIAICFCLNFVMAFSVFPSAVLLGEPSGPTRVIAVRRLPVGVGEVRFQHRFRHLDGHGRNRADRHLRGPGLAEQDVPGRVHGGEGIVACSRRKFTLGRVFFFLGMIVYVGNVLGILFTVMLNSASKGWYPGSSRST